MVKLKAVAAGITRGVSRHWLRARPRSHAIDRVGKGREADHFTRVTVDPSGPTPFGTGTLLPS